MQKLVLAMGLIFICSSVSLVACKDEKTEACVEKDIPQTKSGKIYTAKVFALDLAEEFASDAKGASERFEEMQSLGITDVMLLEPALATDYIQEALADSKLKVWMISQIFFHNSFYDPEIPDTDPMWAIKDNGDVAWDTGDDGWLRMACPNNSADFDEDKPEDGFRQKTIARIVDLVETYKPYGVSLDFIRYFAFWEGVAEDADPKSLPDTCFCDRCLALFEKQAGVTIPDKLTSVDAKAAWIHENEQDAWTEFKTGTITSFVKEVVAAIHEVDSKVKINLHAVPWKQDEYDGAIKRITGQDFAALSKYLDWISPMVYAKMKSRKPEWIHEVIEDVATVVDPGQVKIMPAIQIEADGGETVTTKDFQSYLEQSLKDSSAGVAFWPWERITEEQKDALRETLILECQPEALRNAS